MLIHQLSSFSWGQFDKMEEEMNELNIASFLSSVQIAIMRAQGLHFQVDSIIAENVLEIRGHLKLQSATGSYV